MSAGALSEITGPAVPAMATSEVWWIGTWVSKTVSLLCLAVEVATILEPDCSLSLMLPVSLAFADTMTACLVDDAQRVWAHLGRDDLGEGVVHDGGR